jgi:hypothetical protein
MAMFATGVKNKNEVFKEMNNFIAAENKRYQKISGKKMMPPFKGHTKKTKQEILDILVEWALESTRWRLLIYHPIGMTRQVARCIATTYASSCVICIS